MRVEPIATSDRHPKAMPRNINQRAIRWHDGEGRFTHSRIGGGRGEAQSLRAISRREERDLCVSFEEETLID